MKYLYLILIFIVGFAAGRFSIPAPDKIVAMTTQTRSSQAESPNPPPTELATQAKNDILTQESKPLENPTLVRTDDKARDKQVRQLFSQLTEANQRNQIEEQNKLFREMESLSPRHETVFQAKVMFLLEDEDWKGAHDILEECVSVIPDSAYCLRKMVNIRSSTLDEKIRYGSECLQISKNDLSCLVDLAIALTSKGEFGKAKDYFEQALNLPQGSEGHGRDYILYHYAYALEKLGLYPKAKEALAESCKLNMKSVCEELRRFRT